MRQRHNINNPKCPCFGIPKHVDLVIESGVELTHPVDWSKCVCLLADEEMTYPGEPIISKTYSDFVKEQNLDVLEVERLESEIERLWLYHIDFFKTLTQIILMGKGDFVATVNLLTLAIIEDRKQIGDAEGTDLEIHEERCSECNEIFNRFTQSEDCPHNQVEDSDLEFDGDLSEGDK